jgi:hypothetical protein
MTGQPENSEKRIWCEEDERLQAMAESGMAVLLLPLFAFHVLNTAMRQRDFVSYLLAEIKLRSETERGPLYLYRDCSLDALSSSSTHGAQESSSNVR